nr:uncharacterized protein LOC127346886 [Lolium perenne]
MPENWDWGLMPHDRASPPELLFDRQGIEDGDLAQKVWTPDHADPADQAGDQAGDDELPEVPDQGGQGEHNPPPSLEQQEEEPATSATGPILAVPLRTRPPAASATSAPRRKKRAGSGSTAALETRAKKQRQLGPKKVPEATGAAIKFTQGGGSRSAPRVVPPLPRQRREPTPPPSMLARAPPVVVVPPATTPPSAGVSSSAAPPAAPGRGAQGESVHRPGPDELFPRRAPLLGPAAGAGEGAPSTTGAGAGGAAPPATGVGGATPSVVEGPEGAPQAPEMTAPTGPTTSTAPPPASEPSREEPAGKEPARDEPARSKDAGSRALVRTKGPSGPPEGLHVAKGARLLSVSSASDSSLGSAGTMEKAWHQADACEVSSREGQPGVAPMNMFFSGFRASLKAKAAETIAQLATLEDADKLKLLGFPAFPEAQEAALTAAGKAWEARRQATGEQSSACFSMDDYLVSMAARVDPITKLGWELWEAAEELIRLLWPTETLPQDLANLIKWLETAPDRFHDWKESAARAGADMALSFVPSWYDEVNLGQLECRRAGVEENLPKHQVLSSLPPLPEGGEVEERTVVTDDNQGTSRPESEVTGSHKSAASLEKENETEASESSRSLPSAASLKNKRKREELEDSGTSKTGKSPVKETSPEREEKTFNPYDDALPPMQQFIRLGTQFIGYRDHANSLKEALTKANKRADDLALELAKSEKAREKAELESASVESLRKRLHDAENALSERISQQIARGAGKTSQEYQLEKPEDDRLLDALSLLEISGDEARQSISDAKAAFSWLFPYFFQKTEEPNTFAALAKRFIPKEDLGLALRQENLKIGVEGTIALVAESQQSVNWTKVGDAKNMETKRWQSMIKAAKPHSKKILAFLGYKPTPSSSSAKPEVR